MQARERVSTWWPTLQKILFAKQACQALWRRKLGTLVNKTWDPRLSQEACIIVGEETANIQGHPNVVTEEAKMEMNQSNV